MSRPTSAELAGALQALVDAEPGARYAGGVMLDRYHEAVRLELQEIEAEIAAGVCCVICGSVAACDCDGEAF